MSMPEGYERMPFRLAFRVEGELVNAYYAAEESMKDALLLGSLRRSLAERPGVFDVWRLFMQERFGDVVEERLGVRPVFPDEPEPAPEHERSGRA